MTTIYDPPVAAEPGQTPPYSPWPSPAGPEGPGGPPGHGGGWGQGPGKPARRFRHPAMLAATALVFGLGSFFAVKASGIGAANTVLTTSQIAAQTDPGLVDIVTQIGIQGQGGEAAGTGQVLTSSGLVLTNNHVIDGATSIRVTDIGNGQTYTAKVVGYDQHKDIAVIQLQGASGLQTVKIGNSSSATIGQKVVALGNALGKGGTPSVAVGHITGLGASITASDSSAGTSEHLTGLIHHNAPIQPGDSGGPLVNTAGQVVGIDTAASGSTGFQFQTGQSSGQTQAFAIPINEALAIARQIEAGQSSSTVHIGLTGMLGVEVMNASNAAANGIQAGSGAVVAGVVSGAPAAQAGITAGDVITSAGGQRVSSPEALQAALEQHHPGDSVTIGWTDQSGQSHTATVTLVNGPAA